jgi:hypothetical protein
MNLFLLKALKSRDSGKIIANKPPPAPSPKESFGLEGHMHSDL